MIFHIMLTTFFADIEDFRRPQGQKYELSNILLLSVIAILCNAKSYRDISRFITGKFPEIKRELSLSWKKAPAYTTIRNIIKGINSEELEAAFRGFMQSQTQYGFDDKMIRIAVDDKMIRIAVDGKVLRLSFDNFEDKKALQKLMFFDSDNYLILGHIAIDEKSNEIPAFQNLLTQLEIPNTLFTADALHCQKKLLSKPQIHMACSYN